MLKINVTSLDGLSEELKGLYALKEDGSYQLKLEGYQDPGALIRAKQHERDAHNATKQRITELEGTINSLEADLEEARRVTPKAGKEDAFEQQRASYEQKIANLQKKFGEEKETLTKFLEKTHKDDVAHRLATELSETPDLLVPFIQQRLSFDLGVSGPETRVLDSEGKLSASTVDELRDEFRNNPKFAALVKGTQANGGGTSNTNGKGVSGPKDPSEYTESDRVALAKSNPAEFQRMFGNAKAPTH